MNTSFTQHQTAASLLSNYAISMIPQYADLAEACVNGDAPRLIDIQRHYKDDAVSRWLKELIEFFCKASSLENVDDLQIGMTVQLVMSKYGTLKISEMMLFASKFLTGEYEKFFKYYDIQVITRSLAKFAEYRNTIQAKYEVGKMKPAEKRVNGRENYIVYLNELQKAIYGNKDSYDYLRFRNEEDMVVCACMTVKRGDMPESILDSFTGRGYDDLIVSVMSQKMLFKKVE